MKNAKSLLSLGAENLHCSEIDCRTQGLRQKRRVGGQRSGLVKFGGGVNAFSRYETGRTKPPVALVKLLKLLDRHPNLLDEIRSI